MAQLTLEEALAKLDEQKHIAEAIEQKDGLINSLQAQLKELKKEIATIKTENQANKHLASAIEAKDEQIRLFGLETDTLKKEVKKAISENEKVKVLEDQIKQLTEQSANIVGVANGYINNFRSYLKATQGTIELAVELEALLSEKIKK
jgi:predicted RNase H-like nuclease (RuvC/YqgF family)